VESNGLTIECTVEPGGAFPDAGRVQDLARQALQSLRTAQEHIRANAENARTEQVRIFDEREQLTKRESLLAGQRRDIEAQVSEIVKRTAEIEGSRKQLEAEAQVVAQRQTECKKSEARFAEQEQKLASAAQALAGRETALTHSERELESRVCAIESGKRDLVLHEKELAAQREQLNRQATELDETRETLASMQAQLTRDHQETSKQRDELLKRLDRVKQVVPSRPEIVGVAEEPISAQATPLRGPKPAIVQSVDQFRKLRRDSKRKAIGV